MAKILIDMELPESCGKCDSASFRHSSLGDIVKCKRGLGDVGAKFNDPHDILNHRHPDCPLREMVTCKDCKYFEYDHVADINGIPLIVAHEVCMKWSNGVKTREDGYCFLAERRTDGTD